MNHVTIAVERNLSDCEVARKKLAQVKTVVLLRSILNSDVTMRIFYALNTYPVGGGGLFVYFPSEIKVYRVSQQKKIHPDSTGIQGIQG